jgi:hypothetical protein
MAYVWFVETGFEVETHVALDKEDAPSNAVEMELIAHQDRLWEISDGELIRSICFKDDYYFH